MLTDYRAGLQSLFDAEYLANFGTWDPEQPYGYAPHDVHLLALHGDTVVGHVGWGRRRITVGEKDLSIAGVGGVLVSPAARGTGLGAHLMKAATDTMGIVGDVSYGYLGCRREVVPFYESCGWQPIVAVEHYLEGNGKSAVAGLSEPLLIYPISQSVEQFPHGEINLRGRAW